MIAFFSRLDKFFFISPGRSRGKNQSHTRCMNIPPACPKMWGRPEKKLPLVLVPQAGMRVMTKAISVPKGHNPSLSLR